MRGDAQRAGDVRLIELHLGAQVHDERPVVLGLLDLARAERVRVDSGAGWVMFHNYTTVEL